MVKRCCYGTCNSDSRYPDRIVDVHFIPFPKPKRNFDKCVRWIKACGRPTSQLNVHFITRNTYICSKVKLLRGYQLLLLIAQETCGYQNLENLVCQCSAPLNNLSRSQCPDPIPAVGTTIRRRGRCAVSMVSSSRLEIKRNWSGIISDGGESLSFKRLDEAGVAPLELLAASAELQQLRDENAKLKASLAEVELRREHRRERVYR